MTSDATRCPACGAAVPGGAAWCSLCYHDLRPAPAPAPSAVPVPAAPAAPASALLASALPASALPAPLPLGALPPPVPAALGRPTAGLPVGGTLDDAQVAAMLAALKDSQPGPLAGVPTAPRGAHGKALLISTGLGVAALVVVALTGLGILLGR